ncbi:MAG: 4-amino-4-deoxy-L-arabinose transferase [Cyanobium sp.]
MAFGLLWLGALALALIGLDGPPLRDWDEGIVARVALELSQRPWLERLWPTYWGDPYLNKPPGLHWLLAAVIDLWRALARPEAGALPPDGLLRLLPSLITSLLVPLLVLVQLRLRPGQWLTALCTGAITLTLLPIVRFGHLVMLDGCQLVAMVLLWWAVLGCGGPPRRLLLQALPVGLAASALLLLKAPTAVPVLGGTLLLRVLERDLSRRQLAWLLLGVLLGLLPGLAWHGGHALVRGGDALQMWLGQGFGRVGEAIEGHGRDGVLTPLLQILQGGWPWLPLWPFALALAWGQRRSRGGYWCLGLTLLSSAIVLPLRTQLPWYSLLLWPAFALTCAPALAWLVQRPVSPRPAGPAALPVPFAATPTPAGAAVLIALPRFWSLLGLLLLAAGLLGPWFTPAAVDPALAPLRTLAPSLVLLGSAWLLGGWALGSARAARRRRGLVVLVLGHGLALALLLASPLWLWELNESWPVGDGLALLQRQQVLGAGQPLLLWRQGQRPSLNWYAGRQLHSVRRRQLPAAGTVWLLGRQEAEAKGLSCRTLEQRGELRLQRCSLAPQSAAP